MAALTPRWIALLALLLHVGLAQAGTVTYVYSDPQGTPLAEADASGNITATFDYRPYGEQTLGAAPNGPGYTGHVNDPETGLVYMQARYYDPAAGRFLSVDPVAPVPGNGFGFNRYSYANNNPVRNIDPNGKLPLPPLFQLNWFHRVEKRAADEALSNTIKNIPSRQQAAAKLDKVNLVATGAAFAGSEFPPVAGIAGAVDETTALGAFLLYPTGARALNVATLGAFSMLKVTVKTATIGMKASEQAMKSVEHAELSRDAGEIIKAVQENHERQEPSQPSQPGQSGQNGQIQPIKPPHQL